MIPTTIVTISNEIFSIHNTPGGHRLAIIIYNNI